MTWKISYTLLFMLLISCNSSLPEKENTIKKDYATIIDASLADKLIPITNESVFKFGAPCAFINEIGDTVIPFGRFSVFATDTLVTYTFVKDVEKGVVGINRKGEILFDAFVYGDVQLDQYSEGLVRILQNEKIGYADKTGKIVINPKYKCAFPFINGKAKVANDCEEIKDEHNHSKWESNSWYYINKNGDKIK